MSARTLTSPGNARHEWLTTDELAELLKVPVSTVRAWRHNGSGPQGVRLGRHVRYRQSTVTAWIAANEAAQHRPTVDADGTRTGS